MPPYLAKEIYVSFLFSKIYPLHISRSCIHMLMKLSFFLWLGKLCNYLKLTIISHMEWRPNNVNPEIMSHNESWKVMPEYVKKNIWAHTNSNAVIHVITSAYLYIYFNPSNYKKINVFTMTFSYEFIIILVPICLHSIPYPSFLL